MKKCLTFPFLFMACVAFAQPKIHSIITFKTGNGIQKNVQLLDYQDNGLIVKTQIWRYQPIDSTPVLTEEFMRRFRNDGQLISEESRQRWNAKWYNGLKTDNKYDLNGCRIESKNTHFDIYNQESSIRLSSIQNNSKCLYLSDTTRVFNRNYKTNQLELDSVYYISVLKTEYDNQDSIKALRYYSQNRTTPTSLTTVRTIEYTRRSDGKIVSIYELFPRQDDLFYNKNISIEYNAKGQIAMRKEIHIGFGSWKDSIVYSYNLEGRLSTEVRFYFVNQFDKLNNKFTTDYNYYCDGLLKTRTMTPLYTTYTPITKDFYTYTEGSTCDKRDLLDFTIAPNPAQFQAIIASEALSSADCTLTIYNGAGALIQMYKIGYRTTTFDFSTANLAPGTYLLRLTNEKNSVAKKLIVVH